MSERRADGRLRDFVRVRVGGLPGSFWVLWCGSLVNRLGAMVNPFLSLYLTEVRGVSIGATGLVLTVVGVGSVISQPLGGAITDRFGRRVALTGGMLANGAVLLTLGHAQTLPAITAAGFALGVTIDLYRPAAQALVADTVPGADRTRAFGLLLWSVNLGFSAAMIMGGYLATHDFQLLFWVDAAACAVFGLLVWLAVPEPPRPDREHAGGTFRTVLRDRVMLAFAGVVVVYGIVFQQALVTLPLAMREGGLSGGAYGVVMSVNGIVVIAVQPLIGHRLAAFDKSRILACGFTIAAVGNAAVTLASGTVGYALAVAVWSVGEVLVFAVTAALVADLAPAHLRGRYNGLLGMAWGTGFLIAPLVGTRLLVAGAPALWLTCAVLCLAAAAAQLALAPAIRARALAPTAQPTTPKEVLS
ncbi:Predicted arabinose efflux permease, MFS family [Streptomyces sp. yr375]|uniref:MDR family MFS transporter n=1 Tax=Streptomyces sp. yr375 TaxID=1761906 RepID=UPI0008D26335|nr:MFS transporter [Streptomyces sp. yr375]SER12883.1 Predicted arabinose efflux permease, MFS family [Streptomyces sp. yr375]